VIFSVSPSKNGANNTATVCAGLVMQQDRPGRITMGHRAVPGQRTSGHVDQHCFHHPAIDDTALPLAVALVGMEEQHQILLDLSFPVFVYMASDASGLSARHCRHISCGASIEGFSLLGTVGTTLILIHSRGRTCKRKTHDSI